MNEEKKFIVPEAEIVDFTNDDIITLRGRGALGWGGEDEDEWENWRV